MNTEEFTVAGEPHHASLLHSPTNPTLPEAPQLAPPKLHNQPVFSSNAHYQQLPIPDRNPLSQRYALAPWLWPQAEHDAIRTAWSEPSVALFNTASPESSQPLWFSEPLETVTPQHVALSNLELTPSSSDYEYLKPVADWCDNTDSFTRLDTTSMSLSPGSTNAFSLAPFHGQSSVLHISTSPKRKQERTHDEKLDPVRRWVHDHPFWPYPTPEEKRELATAAGVSIEKLNSRLTNLRKRDGPILDRLRGNLDAGTMDTGDSQYRPSLKSSRVSGRKGKKPYLARPPPVACEGSIERPLQAPTPDGTESTNLYHCTIPHCPWKPSKTMWQWKRHEAGVHGLGSTRWVCLLNNTVMMTGGKCIFCSDIVHDMSHFHQHNIQVCLAKDRSARVFDRKDGLKQHVVRAHLSTANDYTKRGFEPPDVWSETEDGFSPNLDGLWCGFCRNSLETTTARMDHVAQHFRDGIQISTWVQRTDNANNKVA